MRLYLDNCCFYRPHDDSRDVMVRMEADAVIAILDRCESGDWELCGSDVLLDELSRAPNLVKKRKALLAYQAVTRHIDLTGAIAARAKEIADMGVKPYDSLHLASAEADGADVFLTTDRRLAGAAKRAGAKVRVANPLLWLTEVLYDER